MELIEGRYYQCKICGRVYRRRRSKHPWPSCGHTVSAQQEISEEEYQSLKNRR